MTKGSGPGRSSSIWISQENLHTWEKFGRLVQSQGEDRTKVLFQLVEAYLDCQKAEIAALGSRVKQLMSQLPKKSQCELMEVLKHLIEGKGKGTC